ncbi:hypothetical protein L6R52_36260 [Myxococcota bacterium]|nr:hypothetical protein [Myxococcota bacterium]
MAVAAVFGGLAIADQPQGTPPLRAVGQSCTDAVEGELCASGICIDAWPFGNVCSALCASDAECTLENWGCHFVREPTGKMTGLCAPRRIGAN